MSPTIILIRHAQAIHTHNFTLPDPPLSDYGCKIQCEELSNFLQNNLPLASQVGLIVVSPLRRTLQTATQSLGWLIKRGVPVQMRAEWQENSDAPCDIGSALPVMEKEWPQFDWSTVDPIFPAKIGLYAYTIEALTKRGVEARRWLKHRPEKVIAVVSHSAFLRCGVSNRKYANADFRIFEFAEGDGQADDAQLVEWELTESNGGGLGRSPRGVWGFGPDEEALVVKVEQTLKSES